ncbi:unnamed protein product [Brassica oleracea var. botrytis]|uniref:(rape) hypothetical protein n=1 Tax=Brassica napus TaxID=3708 RepID=A0A078GZK8_BRANA|nr:unnamed protein product [Brassica napus]CDY30667.1 BnaC06g10310D [Brassica napus]
MESFANYYYWREATSERDAMGRRYCAASNKTDEEVEIHFRPDDIVIAVGDVFYAIANVEMGDAAWTLVVLYLTSTSARF